MSEQVVLDLDPRTIQETSMVDLAFLILKKSNNPFYYRDIMQEVARLKGLSDDEVTNVIAQLYTEINIDGRFACVGQNLWGLKRWYPIEKSDDNPNAPRTRLVEDDDDGYDDDDTYANFNDDDEDYSNNDDDDNDNDNDADNEDDDEEEYDKDSDEDSDDDDADTDSDLLDDDEVSDTLIEDDDPTNDGGDLDNDDDEQH
jgi:DNA-directed RNA polymerase subunit delta